MTITAAADGSALGNPGPAGWAWYIDDDTWRAGGWPHGTNNMGELKAVLDLLETTGADPATTDEPLVVLCDSQYVINSVTKWMHGWKKKGWKKRDGKPVQNVDLMKAIDAALTGRDVTFQWVKGHAGHPMNEAADSRANAAATAHSQGTSPDAGPGLGDGRVAAASGAAAAAESPSDSDTDTDTDNDNDNDNDNTGASDLASRCADREIALYTDEVRGDHDKAGALLHPELRATEANGEVLDRAGFLAALAPLRGFNKVEVGDVVADEVSPGVVLVTSTTTGPYGRTARSSLWLTTSGEPTLRHHQVTQVS
ncbi:MAG TPA: ribonuclease HI family protein [Candidatus Corynebacterium avicola]|uniref:Ribonuclease H n=1 Tax=Candidatus Corynebacterium avicola TaxID=2838527 RepID=A0A9D1RNG0_9CORY|nr:ribonuclease HI family protein [Candidatus Corynebacterium avicola]